MLEHETLIDLQKAADWLFERTGRKPHVATLHRWATRGVRGVKLETLTAGHIRLTSVEAIGRFMKAAPPEPVAITEVDVQPGRAIRVTRNEAPAVAELKRRVFSPSKRTFRVK